MMAASGCRQDVQDLRDEVMRLLERHRVLTSLASRQQTPRHELLEQMQHRQNLVELQRHLRAQHPADIAVVLDSLSGDDRRLVFGQLDPAQAGAALVESSDAVRASLIEALGRDELVRALGTLDADDLAFLASEIPDDVMEEVSQALAAQDRSWLKDAQHHDEDSVGRLMTQDVVVVRDAQTVAEVLEDLRTREIPDQTDRLFVVDTRQIVRGALPLHMLVRGDPAAAVRDLMLADVETFTPETPAAQAAKAFERYDLVSAPVVDDRAKLLGRITIDRVMDYLRESAEQLALTRAGLRGAEDLFATVRQSVHNRWPWLALNLVTAFLASRVISQFETTITSIVALAALMPIVASIGGNTGNQTVALVIRALALDQLGDQHRQLVRKELTVSLVNGLMWGAITGLLAFALYHDAALGAVMMTAVLLNLIVAAVTGIVVPLVLHRARRDPAQGASVMLTFITDSMGFFLFLGLAHLLLL
ncbi:MAG: magnesium transporter [Vicinamibacterales bacterium]